MRGSGRLVLEDRSGLQLVGAREEAQVLSLLPSPVSPVLHENQLTHTDLKPENILFVNSEFETLYNEHKVWWTEGKAPLQGWVYPLGQSLDLALLPRLSEL